MITRNFHPNYDGNMRFAYHDDQTWKGNQPLIINRTIVKKYVTVPRYKYDFNFGVCEYSILDNRLHIYKCYLNLCDGWQISITSSGSDYWISFNRITHEQCIDYRLPYKDIYELTDKIAIYKAIQVTPREYLTPTVEQREMIENIILMKVKDCFIWNEIIQPFLTEMYKEYSEGNLEFSRINKK